MWRNYLTVGVRALAKNKTYAFINVFGLALGMAACLMILLYVRYEMSFDKWLPNSENTYQLETHFLADESHPDQWHQMASYISGQRIKKDFPQVEGLSYLLSGSPSVLKDGEAITVDDAVVTDGPVFDVLKLPFARGNPATALQSAGSVVLSETQAKKLFDGQDALGKTLTMVRRGNRIDYRVTGILKELPKNSALRINMIARADFKSFFPDVEGFMTSWGWQSGWYYLTLKPGTDPATIEKALPAWEKRNIPDEPFGDQKYNAGDQTDWHLQNIRDVHLGVAQAGSMTPGNDRRSIVTFAIIAFLILGMACINFTNLATARAGQRAREVSLRKVLGATRRQLVIQFLGESMLVAGIATLIAVAMVELLLPGFASFLDATLELHYFGTGGLLLPILGLMLLVGAAGGIYPAFYLSRFHPAEVLKANKSASEAAGSGRLRNVLVVGQFAVSIGLIICTYVVYSQSVYARTANPGFVRDGLIQLGNIGSKSVITLGDSLPDEVRRIKGVTSVGRTSIGIATGSASNTGVQIPGKPDAVTLGRYAVDAGFFDTMGIKLLAGRQFDANRTADDATQPTPVSPERAREIVANGVNVVLNELAVKQLGFKSPADAIGKTLKTSIVDSDIYGLTPVTIIGVVGDSRFRTVRIPIDAIMFRIDKEDVSHMVIRYDGSPQQIRGALEKLWKSRVPDVPFDATFSEDIVKKLYRAEDARAETFAGFALLAVIIACLGLFGLAAFTAERRTKEIGIRKVLGARTRDIVRLLVWQFSRPILIANIIAWPVAWWIMRGWLNNFDDRITLTPVPFVMAGTIAMGIAVATISAHAWRVARTSPIRALRYE